MIIEVLTYPDHVKFKEKIQDAWIFHLTRLQESRYEGYQKESIVDFMPTTDVAIGFENKWYPDGYANAIEYAIDDNENDKILAPDTSLQQSSKLSKTVDIETLVKVKTSKTLFICSKTEMRYGPNLQIVLSL